MGVPGLQAALAQSQQVLSRWEAEQAAHQQNLQPMRNKLADAEKKVADADAHVAKLQNVLAAVEKLLGDVK
jgi:hypothetical protein